VEGPAEVFRQSEATTLTFVIPRVCDFIAILKISILKTANLQLEIV
jgi:hypothetical protein